MAAGDGGKAGRHEESGQQQPEAPATAAVAPVGALADVVADPGAGESPDVLSARGSVVVRLDSPLVTSFELTVGTGDDAEKVTLTSVGVRVNKAQAQQILETAVAHGVTVRLDPATEESE